MAAATKDFCMSKQAKDPGTRAELRSRAVERLSRPGAAEGTRVNALAALSVLHEMSLSPATAPDALALMHELQVHQVELDLQEDELRRSRAEVEAALARSNQLYDSAPVGLFTIERNTALVELNQAGARLLGGEPETLLGRPLAGFLTPSGGDALHTLLTRVADGQAAPACTLELARPDGAPLRVFATVSADPAGPRFLMALLNLG
jgi:PAS domain S-box-containing protein